MPLGVSRLKNNNKKQTPSSYQKGSIFRLIYSLLFCLLVNRSYLIFSNVNHTLNINGIGFPVFSFGWVNRVQDGLWIWMRFLLFCSWKRWESVWVKWISNKLGKSGGLLVVGLTMVTLAYRTIEEVKSSNNQTIDDDDG